MLDALQSGLPVKGRSSHQDCAPAGGAFGGAALHKGSLRAARPGRCPILHNVALPNN